MLICNFQKLVTICCKKERVWNPGLRHLRPKYLWLNMLPLLPLRETESCTAFTEHEQKSSHFQIQVIKRHRDHRASLTVGKGDTCLGNTKNGLPHLWGTQKGCPQDRRAKLFCIFVFSCIFSQLYLNTSRPSCFLNLYLSGLTVNLGNTIWDTPEVCVENGTSPIDFWKFS